uniref:Putative secreted protein n=1 Tax=Ixodes ricinus TaxID=34613 RepID=A0A6B0UGN7_IXORI
MVGVAMLALATMSISRIRGIPRVTFISPLPAKWKVLSVICVDGSPMLWAAKRPTGSPGSQMDFRLRRYTTFRKSSGDRTFLSRSVAEPSGDRLGSTSSLCGFLLM